MCTATTQIYWPVSLVSTDRALSNYWDLRLKSLAFTAGQDDQSAEQSVYEIHSPYVSYFLLLYCYCKYTHINPLTFSSNLQFPSLLPILLYLSLLSYGVLHLWKCPFLSTNKSLIHHEFHFYSSLYRAILFPYLHLF